MKQRRCGLCHVWPGEDTAFSLATNSVWKTQKCEEVPRIVRTNWTNVEKTSRGRGVDGGGRGGIGHGV